MITQKIYIYIYQYKDQVGNIRLAFYKDASGNAIIDRANDFYPFGLEFGGSGLNISSSISQNYTYTFQGQEKQQDTGWNSYKWRNYDPTIGRFFNVDPLSEKYAYQSHYNFSENRVIDGIELEGLEVVLLKQSKHNDPIIKAANSGLYKDDPNTKTVHLFAHSNPQEIYNENVTEEERQMKKGTLKTGEQLNDVLNKGSNLWSSTDNHEGFTVVIHACRSGRYTVDKKGNVIEPVVSEMSTSKKMKGATLVAPDERDGFTIDGREIGPQETQNANHNGDVKKGEKPIQTKKFGFWNSFQNGQQTGKQPGNIKPQGTDQRSFIDRLFN